MLRRMLGILIMIVGLSGLILSVAAIVVGRDLVDSAAGGLDEVLVLTGDTLTTTRESLVLTRGTLEQVDAAVEDAGALSANVSKTLTEAVPLLDQTKDVAVERVPDSLDAIEDAIPNLAEAAGAMDTTLQALSAFQFRRELPLVGPIGFDLGIDYEPDAPLDEAVLTLGTSMEGLSDDLRALEPSLILADENLAAMATNMGAIADSLTSLQTNMNSALPLIDDYIILVEDTNSMVGRTRIALVDQLNTLKTGLTIFFVWFAVYQLVPLAVGWTLLRGEEPRVVAERVIADADVVVVEQGGGSEDGGEADEQI